jgi:peptidoglycan hydrolase-like protein with peptidoglycan-binding domain
MTHATEVKAHPIIRRGSRGPEVVEAQKALINRSYSVGPAGADGIFGIHTYRAVLNYQTDRATGQDWAFNCPLVVDGIVGPKTWGRLAPDTIRKGHNGTYVMLAQNILKHADVPSWDPGPVDGIFGPRTETAVRNYQSDANLAVDGIVGPVTWTALWS